MAEPKCKFNPNKFKALSISPCFLNKRHKRHLKIPNHSLNINLRSIHQEIKGKHCLVFTSLIMNQDAWILGSLFCFLFSLLHKPTVGGWLMKKDKIKHGYLFDTLTDVLLPLWSLKRQYTLSTNIINAIHAISTVPNSVTKSELRLKTRCYHTSLYLKGSKIDLMKNHI